MSTFISGILSWFASLSANAKARAAADRSQAEAHQGFQSPSCPAIDLNNTIGHNLEGLDDSVRHMDQHFDPQPFIADGKWVKEL